MTSDGKLLPTGGNPEEECSLMGPCTPDRMVFERRIQIESLACLHSKNSPLSLWTRFEWETLRDSKRRRWSWAVVGYLDDDDDCCSMAISQNAMKMPVNWTWRESVNGRRCPDVSMLNLLRIP